jgi:hypothetical protein
MSKDKNKNHDNRGKMSNDAKDFANITFKKWKKDNDWYDGKKERTKAYFGYLTDRLPDTLDWVVRSGHTNKEMKDLIYAKLVDEDYIKYIHKLIKKEEKIKNIKYFPIIIKEIIQKADQENNERLASDPNAKLYNMSDLAELSVLILKKKLKKMKKAGVDTKLAFDILSIIPTDSVLSSSQIYRIHSFYEALYEHAKKEDIPYNVIMENIVNDSYYPTFIAFSLLERKEKFSKLDDNQKKLYLTISNWCFDTMEKLNKEDIEAIVNTFITARKKDEANNKDSARRYSLSSLSDADYPKISKVITKMIAENDTIKKYL